MDKIYPSNQKEDADLDTELEDGLVKELGDDDEKSKIPGTEEAGFDEPEDLEETEDSDIKEL